MELLTFIDGRGSAVPGLRSGDAIIDLSPYVPDLLSLIDGGSAALEQVRAYAEGVTTTLLPADVQLLAPIPTPRRNVMCVGKNYAAHTRESYEARGEAVETIDYPVIFTKTTTCVNGPYDDIPYDAAVSEQIDYEAELAVIIGRRVKNATRDEALAAVFGYTVLNDVTARDLQTLHKQFFKGKSLDGSCPMGPWIVTADEIADPAALGLRLRLNGETRQESTVGDLIFDIPTTLEVLSLGQTVPAGTIVTTGTPSGVGMGFTPPRWMQPGDVMEAEIDGIGVLRNRVVAG
jgi:2-keto-4-pentenoate hydratase/2-oxohepta-3-ene-1,7-dioic acid hydratase in catechol pathway